MNRLPTQLAMLTAAPDTTASLTLETA